VSEPPEESRVGWGGVQEGSNWGGANWVGQIAAETKGENVTKGVTQPPELPKKSRKKTNPGNPVDSQLSIVREGYRGQGNFSQSNETRPVNRAPLSTANKGRAGKKVREKERKRRC